MVGCLLHPLWLAGEPADAHREKGFERETVREYHRIDPALTEHFVAVQPVG
jgi:hypothetical protein